MKHIFKAILKLMVQKKAAFRILFGIKLYLARRIRTHRITSTDAKHQRYIHYALNTGTVFYTVKNEEKAWNLMQDYMKKVMLPIALNNKIARVLYIVRSVQRSWQLWSVIR